MVQRWLVLVWVLVASAGFLWAQEPRDRSQAVVPWVTEDTAWVVVASLEQVDVDSAGRFILHVAEQMVDPAEVEPATRDITRGIAVARGLRSELMAAGVKEVYFVLDAPPRAHEQLMLVVPAGANAQTVADKLRPMIGGRERITVEQGAAVAQLEGRPEGRKPAADRPELATALSRSDAPVVMAVALPQELRNAMPPELPRQMGGADLAPIQDGFMWGSVELRFTPDPAIHAVGQMDGADNAKGAVEVVRSVFDAAGRAGRGEAEFFARAGKWLTPEAKEEMLVIDLPTATLNEGVTAMAEPMREARKKAKQIMSASQMRQMLMGILMFANDNQRQSPERLEEIEKYVGNLENLQRMMKNPQRPAQVPGYVYLKPQLDAPGPTERVVLYEAYDQWPGGVNVGYADGHVEWIEDEARFLEQLKASGGNK